MSEASNLTPMCDGCGGDVKDNDTFCPHCGALFNDQFVCSVHGSTPAEGVCVICTRPFCGLCGELVKKIFLCNDHSHYEIYENMARVFGSLDTLQSRFVTGCLEQAGLHPFLYSARLNPGPDISPPLFVRVFKNHPWAELKVLVPLNEVMSAEEVLRDIKP